MIDYNNLKKDLLDYYGCAINTIPYFSLEMITKIETASNEELIEIAIKSNFDLNNYIIYTKKL